MPSNRAIVVGTLKGLGEWLLTSNLGFGILNVAVRQYGPHVLKMGYQKDFKFAILKGQNKPWSSLPTFNTPMKVDAKIELHEARRAGTHLDFRFILNGKVYDYAIVKKTDFPRQTGKLYRVVRRPHHSLRYFWTDSHTFPPGEYGEGKMTTIWRGFMVVTFVSKEKIEFEILDGEFKGHYCIFTEESPEIPETLLRMKDPEFDWKERRPFTDSSAKLRKAHENQSEYVAEEKIDGSCTTIVFGDKYNVVASRRLGVDGKPIFRHDQLPPTLKYWKAPPEYRYRRIHGEANAQRGRVTTTAGILNSRPWRARDLQVRENNYIQVSLWDIEPIEPETPYHMRRSDYQRLAKLSPRVDNRSFGSLSDRFLLKRLTNPRVLKSVCGSDVHQELPEQYSEDLKSNEFEGAVWKKLEGTYGEEEPWIKDKKLTYTKMKIVGFTPGQGKYQDTLGAIVVENPETKAVTNVGTGFTDRFRHEVWANQDAWIGRDVEIEGLELTNSGSVRAPRFSRILKDN